MAKKEELIAKAQELEITLTGEETNTELEVLIKERMPVAPPENDKSEKMVPLSMVKELIAEAMAKQAEESKPVKVKKVTEHHAHVWRLNGKWVVDFANHNYDYEQKKIIDPYIKEPIHAFNIFNKDKREFESWITVIFNDGSTEDIPLNRYVERRVLVYCKIAKREKIDRTYSIGEVDKNKEVGDRMVPSGIMIDQEVEMHNEIFHVETPDGEKLTLPDYVIC